MDKPKGQHWVIPSNDNAHVRLAISLLFTLICVFIFAYWPTLKGLHSVWIQFDQSFSHGYLVVVVFLYWLVKFTVESAREICPGILPAIGIVPIAAVWVFGESTQTAIVAQLMLPVCLWLTFTVVFGLDFGRKSAALFLMLYLAIPVWGVLVEYLRFLTAFIVQSVVELIEIPAVIDGYGIEMPGGRIEVANGCSGLNYLLVSLTFWAIHCLQNRLKWQSAIVCLVVAIVLALVGNWVRVFILVMVGFYSEMQHPLMASHGNFGWIVFVFVLAIMLFVFSRLSLGRLDGGGVDKQKSTTKKKNGLVFSISIALICLSIGPIVNYALISMRADNVILSFENSAFTPVSNVNWSPLYEGWDSKYAWVAFLHGRRTELQAYVYRSQSPGKELVFYKNKIASENKYIEHGIEKLVDDTPVVLSTVKAGFSNYLVIWNYKIGDNYTVSSIGAKWLTFKSYFSNKNMSALVVLAVKCKNDCKEEVEGFDKSVFKSDANSVFSNLRIVEE